MNTRSIIQDPAKFKTLMEYAKEMHHRYFRAISAFYAYEALREIAAKNIVGEEAAEENVKTLSKYKNFFTPAHEALREYFFLELAKLFDSSTESLHINKVVNFTASNLKHLTVDAFKEYNDDQDRAFLETVANEYRGMAHTDLVEIRTMLSEHRATLEKLEIYRNKWLAHDDVNKPEPPAITGIEIRSLFDMLAKILNSITGKLNSESWTYSHVERDVKHHTNLVVDHLRRFEPYRLKEIEEKYRRNQSGDNLA
jgi:hypothetical protein